MVAPKPQREPPPTPARVGADEAAAPRSAARPRVPGDGSAEVLPVDPERRWLSTVYQGDVPQLTVRSFVMGSALGGVMALSNLYVGLRTGWSLGVAITACVVSFTVGSTLSRILPRAFGPNLTVLENVSMQSTASAAGYSTGSVLTSAIPALLLVTGRHVPWPALLSWTFFMALLGTVVAVPLKRPFINVEQLTFPSGTAAAETLRSLYGTGTGAAARARALFVAMGAGALLAWLRDAHAVAARGVLAALTRLSVLPSLVAIPGLTIRGVPAARFTLALDGSFILMASGAILGLRTTGSVLLGAALNFGVLAPALVDAGVLKGAGYRAIVAWSLWPGAAMLVTSGLVTFAFRWRTVARAVGGLGRALRGAGAARPSEGTAHDPMAAVEVPPRWIAAGALAATVGVVLVGRIAFGIHPLMGLVAVAFAFVLAVVACRTTGETDMTPIGPLGKVTQLSYGVLMPANVTANLAAASVTASAAASAADLLTDFKVGHLLGANPRKQFLAQLAGVVVGSLVVVPAFYALVPDASVLGTDRLPAPSAQVWKGVAEVLAQGFGSIDPTARWAALAGVVVGAALPILEERLPRHRDRIPSAVGMGVGFIMPGFNAVSLFLGALVAWAVSRAWPRVAERYTLPTAAGLIAGESVVGVVVALLAAAGLLR